MLLKIDNIRSYFESRVTRNPIYFILLLFKIIFIIINRKLLIEFAMSETLIIKNMKYFHVYISGISKK